MMAEFASRNQSTTAPRGRALDVRHRSVDRPASAWLSEYSLTVVIPAYRVADEIAGVLQTVPSYVRHVIVVNDASPDETATVVEGLAETDGRITLISHSENQGVGGAMVSGFRRALELGAQVVIKLDGDGQMNPDFIPALVAPLILGTADYAKGNRFRDFQALRQMPALRRLGNIGLSFLSKIATGYWSLFDPNNGFVAIRADVLEQIPLERIHRTYFFETSILSRLYLLRARVVDVPMPARYGTEKSSLSVKRVMLEFPRRLLACFIRRLILANFVYDFNMESVYLLCGIPMLLAGMLYGGFHWWQSAQLGVVSSSGTVVISALLIILGFQLVLSAVAIDLQAVPTQPIATGPLDSLSEMSLPSSEPEPSLPSVRLADGPESIQR